MVDKNFCMSSYLIYRYVYDNEKDYCDMYKNHTENLDFDRIPVKTGDDLIREIQKIIATTTTDGKAAIALSGGIDSAIMAKFMPEGSTAYTFRCIVPGVKVTDESEQAKRYADICKLKHKIIDIHWEDIENVVDELMKHKGGPIHSIEAQIYIAAKAALSEGFTKFIFGENADIIYGGMNGLLAKDWTLGEFVDRYAYVLPYKVLKNPMLPLDPFYKFEKKGHIDGHDFINCYFRQEALGTYKNACSTAGIQFVGPYSMTYLADSIDYHRIRSGETKYIVREAFHKLYPELEVPGKIPMPRPVNEWFAKWPGPTRKEFLEDCTATFSGDQKWMVWCLERFLNLIDEENGR